VGDRKIVRCGEIEIEFVAVDHDLPGATGFLIRTPDLQLAFTGDHRWHGLHPERTLRFAEAARGADVLILECVSLGIDPEVLTRLTESDVADRFAKLLRRTRGLVVVNVYGMNRERVAAIGRACEAAGRSFLMEPQAAEMAGWSGVASDLGPIRAQPSRHCLQLDFYSLPRLIDLEPPRGSVWVQAGGTPLGRYDPRGAVLDAWVERFGLEHVELDSSGHSWPSDLRRMVRSVAPRVVLPVHSRAPELLTVVGPRRLLPVPLRRYSAGELLAVRA
jgi:ribonuclease J